MADNILFKQGKLANLPNALEPGQILFAIKENENDTNSTTGSIYLDYKDAEGASKRAKLNADATELTTPIRVAIGKTAKELNTSPNTIAWTHSDIGATINKFSYDYQTGKISLSINNSTEKTARIPEASRSMGGFVSTGTQTFGGNKTFNGNVTFNERIMVKEGIIVGGVNKGDTPGFLTLYYPDTTDSTTSSIFSFITRLSGTPAGFSIKTTKDTLTSEGSSSRKSTGYFFSPEGNFYASSGNLGDSSNPWDHAYINTIHGNLHGNANTATVLETPINFTIGNADSKSFDGSTDMSWSFAEIGADISQFSWTSGTTEGPILNLTLNGIPVTAPIPSASTGESGIVTTTPQAFAGAKRFAKTICIGEYNANKDTNEVLGVHFVSPPLASNSPNFGEGQIGIIYDDSTKYLKLSFRDPTSTTPSKLNEIALDHTAFYPISDDKTLGTENKNWKTVYSKTYEIDNAVTLQYNSTSESLEFVFA